MKLFRIFSRSNIATNLKEIRKQNRVTYNSVCNTCIKRAENAWLAKPETQDYLASAGPNSIAAAYTQLHNEALAWADYIWTLR